jgi:plasmid stabilization system protein ParE
LKTEFLPKADEEFMEAARYYENEAPGVGMAFVAAVHKTIAEIADFPLAVPLIRNVRQKILRHFPYNIIYSVEPEMIVIVAVAHQRRRPNYWQSRIKK